jgi:predicted RNA-binding protein associated with RNAse of E/G family
MEITIHYNRIIGPSVIYNEVLIDENSQRIKSKAIMNEAICNALTRGLQRDKFIRANQRVTGLDKIYFYDRAFNVLKFYGAEGEVLGYYSDICTPLTKTSATNYVMTDLILDLWLFPNGSALELDWDEFDHAVQNELISPELQTLAKTTLARIQRDVADGIYPDGYD